MYARTAKIAETSTRFDERVLALIRMGGFDARSLVNRLAAIAAGGPRCNIPSTTTVASGRAMRRTWDRPVQASIRRLIARGLVTVSASGDLHATAEGRALALPEAASP